MFSPWDIWNQHIQKFNDLHDTYHGLVETTRNTVILMTVNVMANLHPFAAVVSSVGLIATVNWQCASK